MNCQEVPGVCFPGLLLYYSLIMQFCEWCGVNSNTFSTELLRNFILGVVDSFYFCYNL